MDPRWSKVFKDLGANKVRTALVVLSIAVGVFAVGMVSHSYEVIFTDLDADYNSSQPHHATLYTDWFGDEQVSVVRHVPGVLAAEGRASISVQAAAPGDKWVSAGVAGIPSIPEMQIDLLRTSAGARDLTDPGKHEVYIDRGSLPLLPVQVGDTITLRLPDQRIREVRVAGVIHDVSAYSSIFANQLYLYGSPETLAWLGGSTAYSQLLLRVEGDATDEAHVKEVASRVARQLQRSGRQVYATVVFDPGVHPVKPITQTLMVMLSGFGALAVFLSAFLVVNTINALLSQHVRQIGVMKAIGARTDQIVGMYLALVAGFGTLALLVSAPLSAGVSWVILNALAGMLNFNLSGFRIPAASLALQTAVALGIPLLAALVPVFKGAQITIREAISSYGLGRGTFGTSWIDRVIEKVQALPRPTLISLRNTFRRKGRLLLTLSTLTLGGALFISVFNMRASFLVTINQTLGYFLSDVNLSLSRPYRIEQVQALTQGAPGVASVEAWQVYPGRVLANDNKTSVEVMFWGPPGGSKLIDPVIVDGRWLIPEDENAVVVGNHLLKKMPYLKVGDTLVSRIRERDVAWKIVGIYQMAGTVEPPFVYANFDFLSKATGQMGMASEYRIATTSSDAATETAAAKAIEAALKKAGMEPQIQTGDENRKMQSASIEVLVGALVFMAVLIALVGSIGLMGTMSMNVLERTREIGVMRSIGASDQAILSMVVLEGMLIGGMSWLMGAVLSLPISKVFSDVVGVSFVQTPLKFVFSMDGFVLWFMAVSVFSALASLLPAWNAARLTIHDVLAYE